MTSDDKEEEREREEESEAAREEERKEELEEREIEKEASAETPATKREWYRAGMWSFLMLFLLAAGLLIYYQFYEGNGKWRFSLVHHSNRLDMVSISQAELDSLLVSLDTTLRQPADGTQTAPEPQYPTAEVEAPSAGTVYSVQIGIFQNYDLRKFKGTFNALHQEKEGSKTKLTLGEFASHEDATAFARDIKKLGIRDAWVVKFQDGKRVPVSQSDSKKAKKKRR